MKKIVTVSTLALLLAGCNPGDQQADDTTKTEQKSDETKQSNDETKKEDTAKDTNKEETNKTDETTKDDTSEEAKQEDNSSDATQENQESSDETKKEEEQKDDTPASENKTEDKKDESTDKPDSSSQDPEQEKPSKPEDETPDVDKSADAKADLSLGNLVVVNKKYSLPIDYKPSDLVVPNVSFSYSGVLEQSYMRAPAAKQMEKMFAAAKKEGVTLNAVSGFRSGERQKVLYNNYVARDGKAAADQYSARPGHSEHQTGLTFDISAPSVGNGLTAALGDTKEGKWIANNAAKYGFIVRYDRGFQSRTGYTYEPWHIRYVGVDVATQIKNNGQTLEEYMKVGH
ncbi:MULTISPECIES: M15 family metallopeptidase [Exiguobacterium]|uniref:D-alanyl-D-alanine carboxypeptidase family protein n=1 Tax=Exiguobacterium acetylicum TaxID=41170 RepID=A0ABX8GCV2_EXIAC|nr:MULTISPECIES: M15 family metallopeptidase [Exiguobacterium]AOT00253.1 peptidase M15 [Exiguobacterium sp. U13-1]QWB31213.1 D-alanyl-D-alanine carboxypeptidase family protein [Exiguobacterium acetylicum]HCD58835.1 peptidase M15 [Exiguobacterium sp.]